MNSRELLTLAAKAARIKIRGWNYIGYAIISDRTFLHTGWNPLEDDGDALRLLSCLIQQPMFDHVEFIGEVSKTIAMRRQDEDADKLFRHAIVHAAAKLA